MKEKGDMIQFLKTKDYIMLNNNLGSGSFGKTVLLKDPFIDELFVAKKYEPEDDSDKKPFFKNFLDEIKILYKLNHKNIVRIFNYYAYEDALTGYIVMEYIDGEDIGSFISNYFGPFAIISLDEVFIQLIDGFKYIEEHDIIHRDIREGNILIDSSGVVKIIDFGIGKVFDTAGNDMGDSLKSKINRANSDTLPEEYYQKIYTAKTDQYYLGEMLNRLIREAVNLDETDFSYQNILNKMIAKSPDDRYLSFTQIKDAIESHDFNSMEVSYEDKLTYQSFAKGIYNSLSAFVDEKKFNYDIDLFITLLKRALSNNHFEDYIQKNSDVIGSIILGGYKYSPKTRIACSDVRDFLNWFEHSSTDSKQLILNNLILKLSNKNIIESESDIPF